MVTLTPRDLELIEEQCVLQNATTPKEIANFTSAYADAKDMAVKDLWDITSGEWLSIVRELGRTVDERNENGWRRVPVVFRNGSSGLDATLIDRTMDNWADYWVENKLAAVASYREFQEIHPFIDGNGRVGHLIWAMTVHRRVGIWPTQLPPDLFKE